MGFVKAYWKQALAGVFGVVLALTVWHAWQDHVALHQVFGIINNSLQQQAAQHAPGK